MITFDSQSVATDDMKSSAHLTFPSSSTLSNCISLCLVGVSPTGNTGDGFKPDMEA